MMKYEVREITSYAVFDGDRVIETYESQKTANCVAEALNNEAPLLLTPDMQVRAGFAYAQNGGAE